MEAAFRAVTMAPTHRVCPQVFPVAQKFTSLTTGPLALVTRDS
jgi:hypothetical protein